MLRARELENLLVLYWVCEAGYCEQWCVVEVPDKHFMVDGGRHEDNLQLQVRPQEVLELE